VDKPITHDFAQQHHVLSPYDEDPDPPFCKLVAVIYPFVRVFKDEIGLKKTKSLR
jgi:hypothetical protein